ncbi:hypothetical protein EV177_006180, partial [Coemansia sp. RSA 1804]
LQPVARLHRVCRAGQLQRRAFQARQRAQPRLASTARSISNRGSASTADAMASSRQHSGLGQMVQKLCAMRVVLPGWCAIVRSCPATARTCSAS